MSANSLRARNQIAMKPSQHFGTPIVECPRGCDVCKYASAELTAKKQKMTVRRFGFTEKVYGLSCTVHTLLLLKCHHRNAIVCISFFFFTRAIAVEALHFTRTSYILHACIVFLHLMHMHMVCLCIFNHHCTTYGCTEAHSHSTVHQTGRFYYLNPPVCSLLHRCRSLQSCRLYWRDCVDHLWEYQDHHSQWLGRIQ